MKRRRFLALSLLATATPALAEVDYRARRAARARAFRAITARIPEFRTEWWYITGWVADADGREYGVQVTFFRNRPGVAEVESERLRASAARVRARGDSPIRGTDACTTTSVPRERGFDLAGADEASTRVFIGDWSLADVGGRYAAKIVAREFALDLAFAPTQPPLPQGEAGVSRKGRRIRAGELLLQRAAARASTGTVKVGAASVAVTGIAWLDHEWSST